MSPAWGGCKVARLLGARSKHTDLHMQLLVGTNSCNACPTYSTACMGSCFRNMVSKCLCQSTLCSVRWRQHASQPITAISLSCMCFMQSGKVANDAICKNDKAKARAFPTHIAQGLLWIWPESGPHSWLESAMQGPVLVPEVNDPNWTGHES